MLNKINEILVVRNDKIGDFVLIMPALSWLKKNLPNCKITCLVSEKVFDLAKQCEHIDKIVIDKSVNKLYTELSSCKFDVSISFFSTFRIGYLVSKLKIPLRIAPKTKLAQIFYNHRVYQNRSKSQKPEYEYNSDLVYHLFNISNINDTKDMDGAPYLSFQSDSQTARRELFIKEYNLNPEKKIIFVHPGTGGSSVSLSTQSFAEICIGLRKFDDYNFIIHCSPDDDQNARNLKILSGKDLVMRVIEAKDDMLYMLNNISICDVFIAGSTGPLHIAGALNKKTIGFYPNKRTSTSLRWQTINDFEKKLNFTDIDKMSKFISIDPNKTILEIQKFISSI